MLRCVHPPLVKVRGERSSEAPRDDTKPSPPDTRRTLTFPLTCTGLHPNTNVQVVNERQDDMIVRRMIG